MSEQPERKKRRQNVACDSCRLRRVKCDMLALLTPKDGGPERPLHVLVRENPDVACTNCVSKGIRCTTNQIVNPAKPNKGGKRIEEAKKMFGSDGFQNAAVAPMPGASSRHHSRRASVARSPTASTFGGSSGASLPSNPPLPLPMFGTHQLNVLGSNTGHSGPTASFVPPAPVPSPTVHSVHGWGAPPLDDWNGIAFDSHNFSFPHPMHPPPIGLDAASWESTFVFPAAPPVHAHSLPVFPSAISRSGPPAIEPPLHSLSDPVMSPSSINPLSASTIPLLPNQPLAASPGVASDVCLPSQPPSRSDSSSSNHQSHVTGRKRALPENEEDDILELVRHDGPLHYDPSHMWTPRDKVIRSPECEDAERGLVPRPLEDTARLCGPHAGPS